MPPERLARLNDPLLEGIIRAEDEPAREREIERVIVTEAQSVTERIVARFARDDAGFSRPDGEDIVSTVNVRLLRKLRAVAVSEEESINQFGDYVAALTKNAIHDHLRRRYPERTKLKNRLRYILAHDARTALWPTPSGPVAGLAEWRGSAPVSVGTPTATQAMRDRERPADAIVEVLRACGQPVRLDSLIAMTAELWDVSDAKLVVLAPERQRDPGGAFAQLETRDFLRALWREIALLPVPQRKALLLNLRDSETVNVASLLAFTGTATFDEIAAAMEMTAEELAGLWNDLPLDDLRIAALLNVTRQQVINLRKSARARLARRVVRS